MKRFATRRVRNITIAIVLAVAFIILDRLLHLTFRDAASFSGWSLLAMVVFLAAYNVLKKLAYFPLGASATWLQAHIYIGLVTVVVFGLHVGLRFPNGVFESVLATLYLVVAISGVFGLLISRMFARRLTVRGGEILFDRIPRRLGMLRRAAERVMQRCLADTESTLLPEFYLARLEPFFATHCNYGHHLVDSMRPRKTLLAEIKEQDRYVSEAETKYLAEVAELVVEKDDLDYQYFHQAMLKYWLFVHIPLTYALLVFAVLHVFLVYAS